MIIAMHPTGHWKSMLLTGVSHFLAISSVIFSTASRQYCFKSMA